MTATCPLTIVRQRGAWRSLVQEVYCAVFLAASLLAPTITQAALLLQDNFDENAIDSSKWKTNTNIIRGPSSVVDQNERIELTNRGYLISVDQFDPSTLGTLSVEGTWTLLQAGVPTHDILSAVTRSDGVPQGAFSEVNNGLDFQLNGAGGLVITEWVNGVDTPLGSTPLATENGGVYSFTILDNGASATFSVSEIGGIGASASLSVSDATHFGVNHIAFYNRENTEGSHLAYLDNVVIQSVPEPSTLILLLLSAGGMLCRLGQRARSSTGDTRVTSVGTAGQEFRQ